MTPPRLLINDLTLSLPQPACRLVDSPPGYAMQTMASSILKGHRDVAKANARPSSDAFRIIQSLARRGSSSVTPQLTLLLFLFGVLDFLWICDAITAGIITFAAELGVGAEFSTTSLPALVFMKHYTDTEHSSVEYIPVCAYKSPQAWLCLRMALLFKKLNDQNVKVNVSHCLSELELSAHPDLFPWRATEGHPTHEESIFLEGEILT
ncbi:hypothetical protein CPB85DRAFT_920948 [Mucidula mucida]|nr:hypothetical protein CPB85DRAFT_920948 [Mucidula mucida]